jgi:Mg-chelatase subunit ChlD
MKIEMKARWFGLVGGMVAGCVLLGGVAAGAEEEVERPRIEVCFVLDTTGSMSGLIEGAKEKIWSIANDLARAKPTPDIRFGLVAYRDRGDEYVVRATALTDDLDAIYEELMTFEAKGGGDFPESVNEALRTAVDSMEWSEEDEVFRAIFLVGDAPPQMGYENDEKYPSICERAVKRGLIINTIQCGGHEETAKVWREIAGLSEGEYVALEQSGGMRAVATPFDEELGRLNAAIGDTLIGYGDAKRRAVVAEKQMRAEEASPGAAASRLAFNSATGKAVQGEGELIDALESGGLELKEVKKEELPEELRELGDEELERVVAEKRQERVALQAQIAELVAKRDAFLREERARLAGEGGGGDAFDSKVEEIVREQAKRKGIEY